MHASRRLAKYEPICRRRCAAVRLPITDNHIVGFFSASASILKFQLDEHETAQSETGNVGN